jgi:hypothetical protein
LNVILGCGWFHYDAHVYLFHSNLASIFERKGKHGM